MSLPDAMIATSNVAHMDAVSTPHRILMAIQPFEDMTLYDGPPHTVQPSGTVCIVRICTVGVTQVNWG